MIVESATIGDFFTTLIDYLTNGNGPLEPWNESVDSLISHGAVGEVYSRLSKTDKAAVQKILNTACRSVQGQLRGNKITLSDALPSFVLQLEKAKGTKVKERAPQKKQADRVRNEDVVEVFDKVVLVEAIYDLLAGKLHRLDPVIGDFGCQWRVPFLLDVYDAVRAEVLMALSGSGQTLEAVLDEYLQYRGNWNWPTLLADIESCKVANSPNYDGEKIQPILETMRGLYGNLETKCSNFAGVCAIVGLFLNDWRRAYVKGGFNALRYLQLCKLFTVNRVRTLDCFGLSGIQKILVLPHAGKVYSECVIELAKYSKSYMIYVMSTVCEETGVQIDGQTGFALTNQKNVMPLAGACLNLLYKGRYNTLQQAATFETQVFYGPMRGLFMYQMVKNQPLIVDVRRLLCRRVGDGENDFEYTFNGGEILYFSPNRQTGYYDYVENPTAEQRNAVGMCIECYSIYNPDHGMAFGDDDQNFLTGNYDAFISLIKNQCSIVDILMLAAASHSELPTNIKSFINDQGAIINVGEGGFVAPETLVMECSGVLAPLDLPNWTLANSGYLLLDAEPPHWDLVTEKAMYASLLRKFELETTEYKHNRRKEGDAVRITNLVPIAIIHIYGCTFAIKQSELNAQRVSGAFSATARRIMTPEECKDKTD